MIEQPEEVLQQLLRAHQAGIAIAIDDFGTGYSNWVYLTQIPASIVKLDRSLVHRAASGTREALLVQSVVGLGQRTRLSSGRRRDRNRRTVGPGLRLGLC